VGPAGTSGWDSDAPVGESCCEQPKRRRGVYQYPAWYTLAVAKVKPVKAPEHHQGTKWAQWKS
jgi:hypothetical protein